MSAHSSAPLSLWTPEEEALFDEMKSGIEKLLAYDEETKENEYLRTPYARRALKDEYAPGKFLRLGGHDIEVALDKLNEVLLWRRDFGTDQVVDWRFPKYREVRKSHPYCWHGTSKSGNPIHYDCPGYLDVEGTFEAMSFQDLVRTHVVEQEYLLNHLFPTLSQKAGKRIHQITAIIDLSNLGYAQMSMTAYYLLKLCSEIDQEYYPDSLEAMYIINAPWIFSTMWNLIKQFLNERTQAKIHVLDSYTYMTTLKEAIDEEQLPAFMGGCCPKKCTRETFLECHELETVFADHVTDKKPLKDFREHTDDVSRAVLEPVDPIVIPDGSSYDDAPPEDAQKAVAEAARENNADEPPPPKQSSGWFW